MTDVATPFTEVPETSPKVIQERSSQEELPRWNEVTRESSREDAPCVVCSYCNRTC